MKQINEKRAVLENGVLRKEVKFGFSMAAFLLGFIYPLIKGDYITAGIAFVIIGITGVIYSYIIKYMLEGLLNKDGIRLQKKMHRFWKRMEFYLMIQIILLEVMEKE